MVFLLVGVNAVYAKKKEDAPKLSKEEQQKQRQEAKAKRQELRKKRGAQRSVTLNQGEIYTAPEQVKLKVTYVAEKGYNILVKIVCKYVLPGIVLLVGGFAIGKFCCKRKTGSVRLTEVTDTGDSTAGMI